jgi:teichuronic acid biosynthesis glycosyltransferase TuaC
MLRGLRRMLADGYDVIHAHFGLTGWCAKVAGARPLVVTFHGTDVRHVATGALSRRLVRRVELAAVASRALYRGEGERPGLPHSLGRNAVLPCGADLDRFSPRSRVEARRRLGLDPAGRYLLFPASPQRHVKRHDRAAAVAERAGGTLLVASGVPPQEMSDWVNAANAVLVTSENEGFGLPAVEALACEVPVLSTPVGVAPTLLRGFDECLCAPFELELWADFASRLLRLADPRVDGRGRAEGFSARRMAARVALAYEAVRESRSD